MGTTSVLRRLLWREFREGLGILLLCLAAPPLIFTAAARFINSISGDNAITLLVTLPASAGVPLAVALWAARKGNTRRNGSEFARTHLPVNHLAEWLVSLFVPLFIVAVLGVWYGYWSTRITDYSNVFEISYYGALNLTALFTLCYFISSAISNWVAVFFSMAWLISGGLISPWDLHPLRDAQTLSLVIGLVMGSVAASFVYVAMWQKKSVAYRQGVSLLLLIIVAVGPLIRGIDITWLKNEQDSTASNWCGSESSPDGSSYVYLNEIDNRHKRVLGYTYENYRTGEMVWHSFPGNAITIGMPDSWRVYFLQYRSRADKLAVLLWDVRRNTVRQITMIPVTARHLESEYCTGGFVSPDNKYLLLLLKSLRGDAVDCWVVDLRTKQSEIAIPDTKFMYPQEAVWPEGKAILHDGVDKAIEIDFRTMKSMPLHIFGNRSRL